MKKQTDKTTVLSTMSVDIEVLPAVDDIRREIEAFKQSRTAPIRDAIGKLEQQRDEIMAKITHLHELLAEIEGQPPARAAKPKEGARPRATKAQMAERGRDLALAGKSIHAHLSRAKGKGFTARKLRSTLSPDLNVSKAVQAWNRTNPENPIKEEGKGAGRTYAVNP
jgi:hypothetical protein